MSVYFRTVKWRTNPTKLQRISLRLQYFDHIFFFVCLLVCEAHGFHLTKCNHWQRMFLISLMMFFFVVPFGCLRASDSGLFIGKCANHICLPRQNSEKSNMVTQIIAI